jgi:hypothetical protein
MAGIFSLFLLPTCSDNKSEVEKHQSLDQFKGQFTADFALSNRNRELTGELFVKDYRYRMNLFTDDRTWNVIVDQKDSITRAFLPARHLYNELNCLDPKSIKDDPFQNLRHAETLGEIKPVGTDSIGGHLCDKFFILIDNKHAITKWVSREFKFPIKIVDHTTLDRYIELSNIQHGPVDDSLFLSPSGYKLQDKSRPMDPSMMKTHGGTKVEDSI